MDKAVVLLKFGVCLVADFVLDVALILNIGHGHLCQPAVNQRNEDDFMHHIYRLVVNEDV